MGNLRFCKRPALNLCQKKVSKRVFFHRIPFKDERTETLELLSCQKIYFQDGAGKRSQFWRQSRVARWFLSEPKIPIWANFGGPKMGKC
jgi:hypothetical protein